MLYLIYAFLFSSFISISYAPVPQHPYAQTHYRFPLPFSSSPLSPLSSAFLRRQRLHIPDHLSILLNASITTKKPHPAHALNTFTNPLLLIAIRLVNQLLRLDIRREIIRHEIVIPVVGDAVAQGAEAGCVAERPGFDRAEDFREIGVEFEGAVGVRVAEVFDVFGQVAEEEDVGFADFARYFDLDTPTRQQLDQRGRDGRSG